MPKHEPKISIILRTKNEERWITFCLNMIFQQTHKNIEVILVDNMSEDKTVKLAQKHPIKLVQIKKYMPGNALNQGIKASTGEYIVCISAHCVPKNKHWLANLLKNFSSDRIAGVYGRQEPLSYTSDADKRDLLIAFGLDRKVQNKDPFFHNANSMLRRDLWEAVPFDDSATNIEDRIWGKEMIGRGYKIVYEPSASVYHYHGIHQGGNKTRTRGVMKIMENLDDLMIDSLPESMKPSNLNVIALLPIRGEVQHIDDANLLTRALSDIRQSNYIQHAGVIAAGSVLEDLPKTSSLSKITRSKNLDSASATIEDVLHHGIANLPKSVGTPDIVVYINYLFPFRPKGLLDSLVEDLIGKGLDTALPYYKDFSPMWRENNDELERVDEGFESRDTKTALARGVAGLGCAILPSTLNTGHILGKKVGLVELTHPLYGLKVRKNDEYSREIAQYFLNKQSNVSHVSDEYEAV